MTRTSLDRNRVTLFLCGLVALCEGIDLQAAGVAAPKLAPALGLKPADLGWFFSASTFGLLLGAAIGGRLSDRFGRKPCLLVSVLLFGVLSILMVPLIWVTRKSLSGGAAVAAD